jgi:hypothetical protein
VTRRLPAFRFLHLLVEVLIGEARVTDERKAGPTPALSLDRTGFALDVNTILQAREIIRASRAE